MQPAGEFLHPKRARILAAIVKTPASPNDLAEVFGDKVDTMDYHLRTLVRSGWAQHSSDDGVDPADRVYKLAGGVAISHASSASASLDQKGKEEVEKSIEQMKEKVEAAERETAKRCAKSGGKPTRSTIAIFGFEPPSSRSKPDAPAS